MKINYISRETKKLMSNKPIPQFEVYTRDGKYMLGTDNKTEAFNYAKNYAAYVGITFIIYEDGERVAVFE